MPNIRPVSDLRNNFGEITKEVEMTGEPLFLTKNGYGSLVVMSMEAYENNQFQSEIYAKLKEAETQAKSGATAVPIEKVMREMRTKVSQHEKA